MFSVPNFSFLKQFFPAKDIAQTSRSITDLFRHEFVQSLIKDNNLTVRLFTGELYRVEALSYDRISNQLIISDRSENGILYLDQGDKVEFYTALSNTHEYFSFISRVEKIKILGAKLIYYMSVPKKLSKSVKK